jgi:hypothetical protein
MLILLSANAFGGKKALPWLLLLLGEEPEETAQEIGPEGGTFKFPSGVILDIPAGAVTEQTTIIVKDVPCSQADTILSARQFASHEKRCIGGFSAEPEGLVFNTPIKATVPVLPLNPGEIPVQVEVDLDAQKYWITGTDLVLRGAENSIEMSIQHFSDYWLAVLYEHIDEVCSKCETWDDPEFIPVCENFDLLQPSCCLLLPAERNKCAPNCDCCREKEMIVEVTEVDFSTGDCQILGSDLKVTFPECPHSPTETQAVSETSADCPEDMTFEIEVDPPSFELSACEQTKFTATITGKSTDGKVLFDASEFNPKWKSTNPYVADFIDPDGTLEAFSGGTTQVQALVSEDSEIPPGEASITVTSNISSFKVTPAAAQILVGGSVTLSSSILDAEGDPLDASTVTWSSSNKTIADVSQVTGKSTTVQGKSTGQATITATYKYDDCETKKKTAVITVGDFNMTGIWNVLFLAGGSECYALEEQFWDEWVREDYVYEFSVTQLGSSLSAYFTDFPGAAPYTGTIAPTGNAAEPYELDLSVSSSNTVDCIKFFESGGKELVFGLPICQKDWKCTPLSCYETEIVEENVLADGNSFLGYSAWEFTARLDISIWNGVNWDHYYGVDVGCEGGAYNGGCRGGSPVVKWIDDVCLNGGPAKLRCESEYGNSSDQRLMIGACIRYDYDGDGQDDDRTACVYCESNGGP